MTSGGQTTSPDLEVLQPRHGSAVVVLQGEHDLSTKDELYSTLSSLIETHDVVVADLSSVLFIDSSALGVLVRADRAARDSGKHFRVQLGTEPIVERVLEISGLLNVLECYAARGEALDGGQLKQPDRLL